MDPLMSFWIFLIGIIAGVIIAITLVHKAAVYPLHKKIEELTNENTNLKKTKKKSEIPIDKYPYPIENFRYIGNPIYGIQFEKDQIIFVTKKIKSELTTKQNIIKKLVKTGKISWIEF